MNTGPTPRRQFVKQLAVTALAGPTILHAQDKSGSGPLIVGSGEHTYECIHDWGRASLPADHQYGWTSNGVAVDAAGRLYVSHHGTPGSIFVFDQHGRFIRAMAAQHRTSKEAAGHGVDIRKEGNAEFLYLSPDSGGMGFTKMTMAGEIVWQKGKAELQKDSGIKLRSYRPTNSSFRPDGGYYLGDGYGSSYVFEYDRDDKFVRALGGPGKEDGQFRTPHGQWLDARDGTPKLVVTDRANQRLQWFAMDGTHVKSLGGFVKPADIDVRGDLLIVADIGASITILDKVDKVVARLGHEREWEKRVMNRGLNIRGKREQWIPGRFVHPHDACFDHDGNIFVSEYVLGGRVTKLRKV
ncbi:MAG: peptidase [Fuerstiella sp.]